MDFEFRQPEGDRPDPVCLVAWELRTGTRTRAWIEPGKCPPIHFDADDLMVAYFSSAEIGCLIALDQPLPAHMLDLYVEFRQMMAGRQPRSGFGLLGALVHFGIGAGVTDEKDGMRQLAQQDNFTEDQKIALLDYCESDVAALEKLLAVMLDEIDFPRALLRGRYMKAVARIERTGIPVDTETLHAVRDRWADIQHALIEDVNADFGVYQDGTFVAARWVRWCGDWGIRWPLHESGRPKLDDDTFAEMAKAHPEILPIKELRASLGQMRLRDLAVGPDGRNRYLLSPFASKTSRNQPSNSKSIFGPATWVRSLIKPAPGRAIAYLDYEQQEFGIGAALSGDENMKEAYASGDPYLRFAIQAGAVPPDATKSSHPIEREQYKTCALGVQYGIGAEALGHRLNISSAHAGALIEMHKKVYCRYWRWSDAVQDRAMLGFPLVTAFGWRVFAGATANPRSLRNFPLQANGAEMLRIVCIALTEAGIEVCAPIHDAVLIEADASEIDGIAEAAQQIMQRASRAVLGDFALRTEAKIIRWPDRFFDPRGVAMWQRVMPLLAPPKPSPPPQS